MKNKIAISVSSTFLVLLVSVPLMAQEAAAGGTDSSFYDRFLANGLLIFAGAVVIGAVFAIYHLLNVVVKMQQLEIYEKHGIEEFVKKAKAPKEPIWNSLYKRWTNVVPVEKEEDIMFDHSFDGIRELDNSLPPWWVAMFYITIAIGVAYFGYYHVLGYGPSSAEKYEAQMERADEQVKVYLASQADQIDETNVELITDESQLAIGKSIYEANCVACHGVFGEGGVGPNFADEYWIHGGDIKDLFATVKYGVPEKGMISWQSQLRPSEMQQVSSYILAFQGTSPPNPKEPQGELYKPTQVEETADTTATEDSAIGMLEQN
jgi:cytochrome c oxidase cbb3-type subunit 3